MPRLVAVEVVLESKVSNVHCDVTRPHISTDKLIQLVKALFFVQNNEHSVFMVLCVLSAYLLGLVFRHHYGLLKL